ncbi:hypothetical protein JPFTNV_17540 [Francisella tularensis subsp. holarctica]|nr:hypothetical protein JPFTNV_17540 [Francisella tularensis subsp. holarctica]BCL54276.1 hypothetical protein JPFTKU_00900 [Francisella tularensis subsp. holarctica]
MGVGIFVSMKILSPPKTAVSQKIPDKPIILFRMELNIIATKNEKPIDIPIKDIALRRFSSLVESATRAVKVLPIAPAPWIARPMIMPYIVLEQAATILPIMKNINPTNIIGLRPNLSDRMLNTI